MDGRETMVWRTKFTRIWVLGGVRAMVTVVGVEVEVISGDINEEDSSTMATAPVVLRQSGTTVVNHSTRVLFSNQKFWFRLKLIVII